MAFTLEELEAHPKFQGMSYDEQQNLRNEFLKTQVFSDPRFGQFAAEDKQKIIQSVLNRGPVMEDKGIEGQLAKTGQAILAGDQNAIKFAMGAVAQHAFFSQATIANFFGKKLIAPEMEKAYGGADRTEALRQYQLMAEKGPEHRKAIEYLEYMVSQDLQQAKKLRWAKTGATVAGAGLDMLIWYGLGAGAPATLGKVAGSSARGLGKLAVAPAKLLWDRAKTSGAQAMATTLESVLHAGATGFLGVARENVKEWLDESAGDPTIQETLIKNAKWFGGYFLGDVLMNVATSVMLPMFKNQAMIFAGKVGDTNLWYDDVFGKGLTDEQIQGELKKRMLATLRGQDIDWDTIRRSPKQVQEVFQTLYDVGVLQRKMPNASLDDMMPMVAGSLGFNASRVDDGWRITRMGDAASPAVVKKTTDAAVDYLTEMTDVLSKGYETQLAGLVTAQSAQVTVKDVIKGVLPETKGGNIDILAQMVAPRGGKFAPEQVRSFAKTFLRAADVPADTLRSVDVKELAGNLVVSVKGVDIAKFPLNAALRKGSEVDSVKKLVKGLLTVSGKDSKFVAKLPEDIGNAYVKSLVKRETFSPAWIDAQLDAKGLTYRRDHGKIQLLTKDGMTPVKTYASFDELGLEVVQQNISQDALKKYLAQEKGLSLTDSKGILKLRDTNGVTLAEGANVADILKSDPGLLDHIPSEFGPTFGFVDDGVSFKYVEGGVTGSYKAILQELERFRNFTPRAGDHYVPLGSSTKGKMLFNKATREVELYMPEIAYRQVFKTIDEAKEFATNALSSHEYIKRIAAHKGYVAFPVGGNYAFYTEGGDVLFARNLEEVENVFKTAPIPEWAPELTGPEAYRDIYEQVGPRWAEGLFKPKDFFEPHVAGETTADNIREAYMSVSQFWQPLQGWLDNATLKGFDDGTARGIAKDLMTTFEVLRGQELKTGKLIWSMFRRGGKVIDKDKRVALREYLEAATPDLKAQVAKARGLDQADLVLADNIRTYFDEAFDYFNVDFDTFLKNYVPHIRQKILENPNILRNAQGTDTSDVMRVIFGNNVPKDLDAFFKHQRFDDIHKLGMEDDILAIMLHYNAVGHRQKILGPVWSDAIETINKAKASGTMKPVISRRLEQMMSDFMGVRTPAEKSILEATQKFYEAMGLEGKASQDIMTMIMSFGYGSAMGFRPWLPIRNSWQVYTTLAPRIGNEWVNRAIKDIAADVDGNLYNALRMKGVIKGHLPIAGGEDIVKEGVIGKLTHSGLKWFQNSDDFTRAVAWQSAVLRYDDAARRMREGIIKSADEFMDMSGAKAILAKPDQARVAGLIGQHSGWNTARELLADDLVAQTMFTYTKAVGPGAFKGIVGKVFGMFGTYPAYYIENTRRALTGLNATGKLAYGIRWTANMTALYAAFQYIGVNAPSFLFWNPMTFSGGPFYQLANTALQATGSNYQGRQARAELGFKTDENGKLTFDPAASEVLKWAYPGSFQYRMIVKGLEYANKGDTASALRAFMSMPNVPD